MLQSSGLGRELGSMGLRAGGAGQQDRQPWAAEAPQQLPSQE